MDKNSIKKYAVWARRELIERVSQRAIIFGITAKDAGDPSAKSVNGRMFSPAEIRQRQALIRSIREKGYEQIMEEAAYTWFNRFAALRYMEVNGYLPSHIRVFTNDAGEFKPQILAEAIHLELDGLDMNRVYELESANKTEELFKYLLIVQCNALNSILPGMFQKIDDYTELLLPDYLLRKGSVIEQMVTTIPETDWADQVQIIGWLYQYYNSEKKDEVFAALKKNVKITKENIPAATQLFTPDWIVRYMVENSLGRLWVEGHPSDELKSGWKYYLEEAEQEPDVQAQLAEIRREYADLAPEQIKCIDPCCGSGHILAYMFDVLVQIYESYGYSAREAAQGIVRYNLHGLDIDKRAAQLAYFAVMMKARQYDRGFFSRNIQPMVYSTAWDEDGENFGSLVNVEDPGEMPEEPKTLLEMADYEKRLNVWNYRYLLVQKYDVVCTNPPYMGIRNMYPKLSNHLSNEFPISKYDLFSAFIERCRRMTKRNRFYAMITQNSWMFINSFEALREKTLGSCFVSNMNHLGFGAFGADFGTTAFVLCTSISSKHIGTYVRLGDYRNVEDKQIEFFNKINHYFAAFDTFYKIPRKPFAYWITQNAVNAFEEGVALGKVSTPRQGMASSDNKRFVRFWPEVSSKKIGFGCESAEEAIKSGAKWFPYNNGGDFRKWYGNNFDLVNWEYDGREVKQYAASLYKSYSRTIKSISCYFLPGGTWNAISSTSSLSVRYFGEGFIFSNAGMAVFSENSKYPINYIIAFLNSKVADLFLSYMSPTLNYNQGDIALLPIKRAYIDEICNLGNTCINVSKDDWDSFETSWDFQRHPLVRDVSNMAGAYAAWERECAERFSQLKANEEELNRIFIDIYSLRDELTPEVEDKDVTVRKADLGRDIRSLISYAVGCMFGRYSIYKDGLAFAGGTWNMNDFGYYGSQYFDDGTFPKQMYSSCWFMPDEDNIIPICDDDYFNDDITSRFMNFIEVVYGKDTLEENLRFIADALGGKGAPREVIRGYFLNDFYADHLKIYQKRPIYWLFDSGKKNGFKALIYMHRYQPDTIARIRTDYVHEQQSRYRTAIADLEQRINDASTSERVKMSKQLAKLQAQAEELRVYEEKVHHLADQMIKIDLDDGVKKNYAIFDDVLAKIK